MYRIIPNKMFFTKGVGYHRNKLQSFELVLRDAGIEKCNLVTISSIFPPDCKIISKAEGLKCLVAGQITFVVLARESTNEPSRLVTAAIGLAHPKDRNQYGYISEHHGFGQTARQSGDFAEDLAATMLASPPSAIPEWAERISGPVLIAASTHGGEEELMSSVYCELKKDFPNLSLIIAPRHPERFREVEDLLRSKGISFIKRSAFDMKQSSPSPSPSPREGEGRGVGETPIESLLSGTIIVLDTVGELSTIYGIADIAVIGKSFRGYGGQNPLEPAYWGKPIICGPHMENFPFVRDFYGQGAALEVKEEGLYPALKELLLSPKKAKKMGERAKEVYMRNTGSVSRAIEVIAKYIR